MDLPENLQRGLYVCRPIRGLSAAIMAVILFFLCWLLWPWLWYFDVESTQVWAEQALTTLGATLYNTGIPAIDSYSSNIAWFITGTTFLPTIVELFTVRFASAGIKAARILVIFFATFDLVTDWPRVAAFVDQFGLNGFAAFFLKIPLLLLASFGLQSLFLIFLICGFLLLINARSRPVGRAYPNSAPAGSVDV
jgi:hypothetical protein